VSKPYRFTAVLATVALAAGATTAFGDGGHGRGHGDRRGGAVLNSAVFGSQLANAAIFGVNRGNAPWVIRRGEAKVRRDGRLKVRVRGLVIPPPGQNNVNPISNIAASVFCDGKLVGTTPNVPFSPAGDARIDAQVPALPTPCRVPTVLLNPAPNGVTNAGTYIAANGA